MTSLSLYFYSRRWCFHLDRELVVSVGGSRDDKDWMIVG